MNFNLSQSECLVPQNGPIIDKNKNRFEKPITISNISELITDIIDLGAGLVVGVKLMRDLL